MKTVFQSMNEKGRHTTGERYNVETTVTIDLRLGAGWMDRTMIYRSPLYKRLQFEVWHLSAFGTRGQDSFDNVITMYTRGLFIESLPHHTDTRLKQWKTKPHSIKLMQTNQNKYIIIITINGNGIPDNPVGTSFHSSNDLVL